MKSLFKTVVLLVIFTTGLPAISAEIDSFTTRSQLLPDVTNTINTEFNARIIEGIRKANILDDANRISDKNYASCNEEVLYTELRKAIFQSFTASWGLKGYSLDKQMRELLDGYSYHLPLAESVYQDLTYFEAFSLNLKELSDVVQIESHLVGLDKLGHFFAEGWQYFEMHELDGKPLSEALEWGIKQEEGKFGYVTTGVFSHADLAANFNGWRFWNRVLYKESDPLKGRLENWLTRAHVSCSIQWIDSIKQKRWVRAWESRENFDIADYVDGTWDEGNNCNKFADETIAGKVHRRLNELSVQCPIDRKTCAEGKDKYGVFANKLLHPLCLSSS